MILNLEHIYKDYQQDKLVVPVLKDVCLQVEEGEYVAIMGTVRFRKDHSDEYHRMFGISLLPESMNFQTKIFYPIKTGNLQQCVLKA